MSQCTRFGNFTDPIIRICDDLHTNQLPTDLDVLKKLISLRKSVVKNEPKCEHFKEVAKVVEDIWLKTNIPIITAKSIIRKVDSIYKKYSKIAKHAKSL